MPINIGMNRMSEKLSETELEEVQVQEISERIVLDADEVFSEAASLESTGMIVNAISIVKEYNGMIEGRHLVQKKLRNSENSEDNYSDASDMDEGQESAVNQAKNEILENFEVMLSQHFFLTRLGLMDLHMSLFEWIQLSEKQRMNIFVQRLIHIVLQSVGSTELENTLDVASKLLLMLPVEDFRTQVDELFADHLLSIGITWIPWDETAAGKSGEICAPSEDYEDKFCAFFVDAMVAHLQSAVDKSSVFGIFERFLMTVLQRHADQTAVFLPVSYTIHLALRVVVFIDDIFVGKKLIRQLFGIPDVLEEDERVGILYSYLEIAEFINEYVPSPPLSILFPHFSVALATETLSSLLFSDNESKYNHTQIHEEVVRTIRLRRAQYAFEWEKLLIASDEIGPLLSQVHRLHNDMSGEGIAKSLSPEMLLLTLVVINFLKNKFWAPSASSRSAAQQSSESKIFFAHLQSLKQIFLSSNVSTMAHSSRSIAAQNHHFHFLTEHDVQSFFRALMVTFASSLRWTSLVRFSLLWLDITEVVELVCSPTKQESQTVEMIHYLFYFIYSLDSDSSSGLAQSHNSTDIFRQFYFESLLVVLDATLLLNSQWDAQIYVSQEKHVQQIEELLFLAQSQQSKSYGNASFLKISCRIQSALNFYRAYLKHEALYKMQRRSPGSVLQLMMIKIVQHRFGIYHNQDNDDFDFHLTEEEAVYMAELLFLKAKTLFASKRAEVDNEKGADRLHGGPCALIFNGVASLLFPLKLDSSSSKCAAPSSVFQQPQYLMVHTWIVLMSQAMILDQLNLVADLTQYATTYWTETDLPWSLRTTYKKTLRKALQQRQTIVSASCAELQFEILTNATNDYIADLFYAPEISNSKEFISLEDTGLISSAFLPYDLLQDLEMDNLSSVEEKLNPLLSSAAKEWKHSQMTKKSPMELIDDKIVNRLVQQGYSEQGALRATWMTRNEGSFPAALSYAVMHAQEKDFDHPFVMITSIDSAGSRKSKGQPSLETMNLLLKSNKTGSSSNVSSNGKGTGAASNLVEVLYRQEVLSKLSTLWPSNEATESVPSTSVNITEQSSSVASSLASDNSPVSMKAPTPVNTIVVSPPQITAVPSIATASAPVKSAHSDWDSFGDSSEDENVFESMVSSDTINLPSVAEPDMVPSFPAIEVCNSNSNMIPDSELVIDSAQEKTSQIHLDSILSLSKSDEIVNKSPHQSADEFENVDENFQQDGAGHDKEIISENGSDSSIDFDDEDDPWKTSALKTHVENIPEPNSLASTVSTTLSIDERLQIALREIGRHEDMDILLHEYSVAKNDFAFHDKDDNQEFYDQQSFASNAAPLSLHSLIAVLFHVNDSDRYLQAVNIMFNIAYSTNKKVPTLHCAHAMLRKVLSSEDFFQDVSVAHLSSLCLPFIAEENDDSTDAAFVGELHYWWCLLRLDHALHNLESGFETTMANALTDVLLSRPCLLKLAASSALEEIPSSVHFSSYLMWAYEQTSAHDLPRLKEIKQLAAVLVDHYGFEISHIQLAERLLLSLQDEVDNIQGALFADDALLTHDKKDFVRKALAEDISMVRRLERLLAHQQSSAITYPKSPTKDSFREIDKSSKAKPEELLDIKIVIRSGLYS